MEDYKILMTLMGMEIGGAETHVLELCKALKKKGLKVYVASNGGAYEPELEACGIVHYKVPMHNKRLDNIIGAYRSLKKIIRENDIKLVHAHARIPGFLCGILQKKLRFRFVTTAHWVFSTEFPFNILSNWGEKSLAVSEDIRHYLMDNYRVPSENIYVTINGIDTEKFAPDTDFEPLRREFNFSDDEIRIVCVSRMEKDTSDRSLVARLLIQAAPVIHKSYPKAVIYLVGGGGDFNAVKRAADQMNQRLNATVIYTPGSRTDVNQWMAAADMFVGASRSMLEAMSSGTPVVAGGNEGYLGLLTEENLPVAIDTNFCYRGCGDTTLEKLTEDVLALLGKTRSERTEMGAFGRAFVLDRYSVTRMADDAMALYRNVLASPLPASLAKAYKSDVMISGYYGYNNSGDDILLQSIVEDLRAYRPDIAITVLSMRPKETRHQHQVNAIYRFNLPSIWLRLRKTHLLITGGGSLIQDSTSTQSLIYYLWVIKAAQRLGAKNMLYANGIGPVTRPVNITRVRETLNKVDLITLREASSLSILKDFGVTSPETYVTADPAFSLRPVNENDAKQYLTSLGITGSFFCVAIRGWKNNPPGFEQQVARFADYAVEQYACSALFVPMRPSEDAEISRRIMAKMQNPGFLLQLSPTDDNDRIRGVVGFADFVLGMRLHTLIYAIEKGIPVIGLVYDPKIQGLMDSMNQHFYVPVETADAETLIQYADAIQRDRVAISEAIREAGCNARQQAARNIDLCVGLLERD